MKDVLALPEESVARRLEARSEHSLRRITLPEQADPNVKQVYVITHIDIIPNMMEIGRELLERYAADVQDEPGLARFELLRQLHRPNHFETVAVWNSEVHYVQSLSAPVTLSYRERLHPLLGSPFDDRVHLLAESLVEGGTA